jgi:hypothetical protein
MAISCYDKLPNIDTPDGTKKDVIVRFTTVNIDQDEFLQALLCYLTREKTN